jgi:hypothetical protein
MIHLALIPVMNYYAQIGFKKKDSSMTAYGYARVSTDGQSLSSQDAELHAAGCGKVYAEKISGLAATARNLPRCSSASTQTMC